MTATNLLALVGILAAPFLGYLAAVRRLSGKINTSDANQLWAESKSIREDYREQIRRANEHIAVLEQRLDICDERNKKLVDENRELRIKILDYEALLERVNHLEVENARLMKLLEQQAHTTLQALNHEEDTPDARVDPSE